MNIVAPPTPGPFSELAGQRRTRNPHLRLLLSIVSLSRSEVITRTSSERSCDHGVFGVSRHAELGDVEAFFLRLGCDAHALHFVHDPKDDKRGAEGPDRVQGRAHQLAPELARVVVKQAGHALTRVPQVA